MWSRMKYYLIIIALLFTTDICKSQTGLASPQIYIVDGKNHSIDDSTMLIDGKKVHLSSSFRRSMDSLASLHHFNDTLRYPSNYFESCFGVDVTKKRLDTLPVSECIAACGKLLLGSPYVDKSLEVGDDKTKTVVNMVGFDCVTFFETSWALATTIKKYPQPTFSYYESELTNHRYRNGIRNGFDSRLHYTSDYFYDNALRGNLKEMTKIIGGKDAKKEKKIINFMTMHPSFYAQLQNDPFMFVKMDSVEQKINRRGGFYYIPKEDVEDIEEGIQTGDLIGITTSVPGIDCSHTGIAIKEKDGRIHFMHASSAMHKVIISPMPLADYLKNNSKQTGIMVYRPIEVK